jgi:hypothetical protein
MYAIDHESLELATPRDRIKAVAKLQHEASVACLDEIQAVNPSYYSELVEALHEPIGDEQRGRIVEYKLTALDGGEYAIGDCSEASDQEDEPLDYCYKNGLLPELDGYYNLPDILGNAIYFQPTAAEVARATHRRTYGITEGDNGIYDILFDVNGNPRGGVSGITRNRRTKAEVEAARKVEAKAKRKEERERAKLLARVAAQRA